MGCISAIPQQHRGMTCSLINILYFCYPYLSIIVNFCHPLKFQHFRPYKIDKIESDSILSILYSLSFQQLQLLELIRAGRAEEALAFASATLAEAGANDPNALTELERSLALLAFPDPHSSPFADLLLPSHGQKVRCNVTNNSIYSSNNEAWRSPRIPPSVVISNLNRLKTVHHLGY